MGFRMVSIHFGPEIQGSRPLPLLFPDGHINIIIPVLPGFVKKYKSVLAVQVSVFTKRKLDPMSHPWPARDNEFHGSGPVCQGTGTIESVNAAMYRPGQEIKFCSGG